MLRRTRRSATVVALSRTNLLALDAHDLHALMRRDPRIAERIKDVVENRVGKRIGAVKHASVRREDRREGVGAN